LKTPRWPRGSNDSVSRIQGGRENDPTSTAATGPRRSAEGQGRWPMNGLRHPGRGPTSTPAPTYRAQPSFDWYGRSAEAWQDQRATWWRRGAIVEAVGGPRGAADRAGPGLSPDCSTPPPRQLGRDYDQSTADEVAQVSPQHGDAVPVRRYQRTGDVESLELVRHTAEAMARAAPSTSSRGLRTVKRGTRHGSCPLRKRCVRQRLLMGYTPSCGG